MEWRVVKREVPSTLVGVAISAGVIVDPSASIATLAKQGSACQISRCEKPTGDLHWLHFLRQARRFQLDFLPPADAFLSRFIGKTCGACTHGRGIC